ncbi:MAG TPA: hypothetical protein VIJ95_08275 [Hanamia sp.]
MNPGNDNFEIEVASGKAKVQRHSISGQVIFRVIFPAKIPPLVLARATRENSNRFWTSIPEGRQLEAEEIGRLIAEHFNPKP